MRIRKAIRHDRPKLNLIARQLLVWFGRNARNLPWRRTKDPYGVWVSEIMLQQTQVATVLPYWERWLREFPTIRHLARATPQLVLKHWEGLGYYSRARNLHLAAKLVVKDHHGQVPTNFDHLLTLPGIGRYTAGAICSIAYDQATPVLDGNVIRVLTRVLGIRSDPGTSRIKAELWATADLLVHESAKLKSLSVHPCGNFNQALMELGAVVCTPRQPQCEKCPIKTCCAAYGKGWVEEIPFRRKRMQSPLRLVVGYVVESQGRILVYQRPPGNLNAGLWEFPNVPLKLNCPDEVRAGVHQLLGKIPRLITLLCTLTYNITRYRYRLLVYRVQPDSHPPIMLRKEYRREKLNRRRPIKAGLDENSEGVASQAAVFPPDGQGRWVHPSQLPKLAFTAAHRKICNMLLSGHLQ